MAAFKQLSDDIFNDFLDLPIQDRTWRIPSPPAEHGLRVARLMAGAMNLQEGKTPSSEQIRSFQFDDEEEEQLMHQLLGTDTYDEMMGIYSHAVVQHVLMTVIIWVAFDEATAALYWEQGSHPKLNRAARRKKTTTK